MIERESDGQPAPTEAEDAELIGEFIHSGGLHPALVGVLERAQKRAREAQDAMLRAIAETENQRKRLERDQVERIRYANDSLLVDMLRVLSSLELCLAHAGDHADVGVLRAGVETTLAQFRAVIAGVGVAPMQTQPGDSFDPKQHEAIAQDATSALPARSVTQVVETGFTYQGRVLRPAKVVVSAGR